MRRSFAGNALFANGKAAASGDRNRLMTVRSAKLKSGALNVDRRSARTDAENCPDLFRRAALGNQCQNVQFALRKVVSPVHAELDCTAAAGID